jgi:hypothetical protein
MYKKSHKNEYYPKIIAMNITSDCSFYLVEVWRVNIKVEENC